MAPETPKTISSRLLTMKFMQRAAASASSSPSTPETTDSQSSKRRKLQHSPAQSRLHAQIDEAAIKAALEDQEAKRQVALAQHLAADTHWVLNPTIHQSGVASQTSTPPLNIVYVGYGDIDSGHESGDNQDTPQNGRTSNRKTKDTDKKKKSEKREQNGEDSGSGSDSDSSDDSSDNDASDSGDKRKKSQTPSSRSQSRSRSHVTAESIRAKEFREKRKKKEVRLNQVTSISSGGGGGGAGSGGYNSSPLTCFNCKKAGHKASSCPKPSPRSRK